MSLTLSPERGLVAMGRVGDPCGRDAAVRRCEERRQFARSDLFRTKGLVHIGAVDAYSWPMAFKEDLARAIESSTSASAAALNGSPTSDSDALRSEIVRLSRRVLVLERLVVQLAAYKVEGGGGDPASIGKHLLYVVKVAMEDADAAADSEGNDDAS
jgi:hypothetical protein